MFCVGGRARRLVLEVSARGYCQNFRKMSLSKWGGDYARRPVRTGKGAGAVLQLAESKRLGGPL